MEASAIPSQNNNFENEVDVLTTIHPNEITTDVTYTSDHNGIVEDSSCPHGSSPKLIDYLLVRNKPKRSIVVPKRYSNSLFVSKPTCDDLIAYSLSVTSKLDDYKPKTFVDAMNSICYSNLLIAMKDEYNSLMKDKYNSLIKNDI